MRLFLRKNNYTEPLAELMVVEIISGCNKSVFRYWADQDSLTYTHFSQHKLFKQVLHSILIWQFPLPGSGRSRFHQWILVQYTVVKTLYRRQNIAMTTYCNDNI